MLIGLPEVPKDIQVRVGPDIQIHNVHKQHVCPMFLMTIPTFSAFNTALRNLMHFTSSHHGKVAMYTPLDISI